jgi:hypothetical protein
MRRRRLLLHRTPFPGSLVGLAMVAASALTVAPAPSADASVPASVATAKDPNRRAQSRC